MLSTQPSILEMISAAGVDIYARSFFNAAKAGVGVTHDAITKAALQSLIVTRLPARRPDVGTGSRGWFGLPGRACVSAAAVQCLWRIAPRGREPASPGRAEKPVPRGDQPASPGAESKTVQRDTTYAARREVVPARRCSCKRGGRSAQRRGLASWIAPSRRRVRSPGCSRAIGRALHGLRILEREGYWHSCLDSGRSPRPSPYSLRVCAISLTRP
jgi:hypothetical protein